MHTCCSTTPQQLDLTHCPNYTAPSQLLLCHHTTLPLSPLSCPLLSSSLNKVPHPGPFSPHQKPQHLLHCLPDHVDSSTLPLVLGRNSRKRVPLSVGCAGIPSCQLLCKPRGNREKCQPLLSLAWAFYLRPHVCCCASAYQVQCLWILDSKSNYTVSDFGMDLLQLSGREQVRYHS